MVKLQGPGLVGVINWYVEQYAKERGFLPKTVQGKKESLRMLLKFLVDKELNLDTAREYLGPYLISRKWCPQSRSSERRILKAFITVLFERQYISENWGLKLELIHVTQKIRTLPGLADAVEAIKVGTKPSPFYIKGDNSINRKIKEDTRAALLLIADTGLRVAEIKSITSKNVFLEDEHPYIIFTQKFGDQSAMDIPAQHIKAIRDRIKNKFIFPVTKALMNKSLKRGAIKLELPPITCHDLRRIYARNLDSNGATVFQIKDAMRHKDIDTTQAYIQYDRNQVRVINQTYHDRNRESLPIQKVIDFALEHLKRIIGTRLKKIEVTQKKNEWTIKLRV